MRGHKVGHKILFLSYLPCHTVIFLLEALVGFNVRLAHFIKHHCGAMLWSDLKLSADVVFYKLTHELVIFILYKIIVANAAADKNLFYLWYLTKLPQHFKIFCMVNNKRLAGLRSKTFFTLAKTML